jgi:glycosyltransferase involved in cell wall biosynthesis
MNLLNVCSSIDLRSGGGTAERTFQMSRALALKGASCTILTLDIGLTPARVEAVQPATVVALACLWRRFYVPRNGLKAIRQLVKRADLVHLMGHWGVLNVLVYIEARRVGKPYVVCPAGALPLFGRSSWLKRAYNFIVGCAIIRNASAWIAVTQDECVQFEPYGIPVSAVTVIPNGVNELVSSSDNFAFSEKFLLTDTPFILFMGRLNSIKGPDLLLRAFAAVRDRLSNCHLVFAGPDGGMLAELRLEVARFGLGRYVHFIGYVDGEIKVTAYQSAQLLVVPSRQEAMSIVALEAGICGTPVLLTNQCGFDEIAGIDPRLVVPATIDGLSAGLLSLLESPEGLPAIGAELKNLVRSTYAWTVVVNQYLSLYHRVLGTRSPS